MNYKVLYRKYRPKNFNELVGQDNIKNILINSIKFNKIAHAYIFTGPRGTGKTSTAKIFAKTLNCIDNSSGISCDNCEMCKTYVDSADIIEIDAASNNGVDEIRTLRDSVKISPYSSKYKIYIIDEVHMLSNSAWNALLKTLEEPPSHVIFILATTEVNKIPETVMSRCQRFDFSKINSSEMNIHLKKICDIEKLDIAENALQEIVKLSNGCLRDALSFLDQVSKYNEKIDINLIENSFGILSKTKLAEIFQFIYNNDRFNISRLIDEISNSGITPMNFLNDFIDFLLVKIINSEMNVKDLENVKRLIYNLNSLIEKFNSVVNPYILIKVELITANYFPGNKKVDISQEKNHYLSFKKEEKDKNLKKNVNENNKVIENSNLKIDSLKNIRINNSFVNPSKEYKIKFNSLWNEFINKLNIENDFNIIGYVENAKIEVVSEKNVIFSFNSLNDSIIFNENLNSIESKFNDLNKTEFKFVALSDEEWKKIRQDYINNKNKIYQYIDELKENTKEIIKTKDIAEDIFGDKIIEIR